MNRRDIIKTAAVGAGLATSQAFAAKATEKKALVRLLQDCGYASQVCIQHCNAELSKGNKSLAECSVSVLETNRLVETFLHLVTLQSTFQEDMAPVLYKALAKCSKACKKHAHHHMECKNCMDSCDAAMVTLKKDYKL